MWILQWVVVVLVVIAAIVLGQRYLSALDLGKREQTASVEDRRKTYEELASEGRKLSTADTSQFLLDIALDLYERKHKAYDTLDDKAQKLVALIGGGASVYALLAGFTGGMRVVLTPILVLSAICFFASLIILLLSLRPQETDIPAITMFNSVPVLADPAYRARIGRRMIEAWQEITLGLTPILRRKGRYIFTATLLIVVGASLLLTNFLVLLGTAHETNDKTLQCKGQLTAKNQVAFSCVEGKR